MSRSDLELNFTGSENPLQNRRRAYKNINSEHYHIALTKEGCAFYFEDHVPLL